LGIVNLAFGIYGKKVAQPSIPVVARRWVGDLGNTVKNRGPKTQWNQSV